MNTALTGITLGSMAWGGATAAIQNSTSRKDSIADRGLLAAGLPAIGGTIAGISGATSVPAKEGVSAALKGGGKGLALGAVAAGVTALLLSDGS